MIDYEVVSKEVEEFNATARKIKFNDTIKTEEHGEINTAVLVTSQSTLGTGRKQALFIDDELFIEASDNKHVMWELVDISNNKKIEVTDAEEKQV